jgi:hypothetical protein
MDGGLPTQLAATLSGVAGEIQYEARLANGESERAESLWGARHVVARRIAFASDPLDPRDVLPAEIWKLDRSVFGGRVFVEQIASPTDLTAT